MKGLILKSLLVVMLVISLGNYLVYLKTGRIPLVDMRAAMGDDWLVDLRELLSPEQLTEDAKQLVQKAADSYGEAPPPAPTKVYKWTDEHGQVHFGDAPKAANAEPLELDLRNSISAPEPSATLDEATGSDASGDAGLTPIEKARAAVEAMEAKAQQQEQGY